MQKKGQITFFLVTAVVILLFAGIYFYSKNYNTKTISDDIIQSKLEPGYADALKAYAESCIRMTGAEALFNRIGLNGGYIDPDGDPEYGEEGLPQNAPPPALYLDNKVPYYLQKASEAGSETAYDTFVPSLDWIGRKLGNYIAVEFEKCFDTGVFEDTGLNIIMPRKDIRVNVDINENDIYIKLEYPLTIKKGSVQTKLDSFAATLPIRLKALHDSATAIIENIKNSQPNSYNITQDCRIYDKNGNTNVYARELGQGTKIIQFYDYSTYLEHYVNTYIFQFAVKDVNVDGSCVG